MRTQLRPAFDTLERRELLDAALIKDLDTVTDSSFADQLVSVGDTIFFIARSDSETPSFAANQLWRSDGTEVGTQLVASSPTFGRLQELTALGESLFFTNGKRLWKSDGTGKVTLLLEESPSSSAAIDYLVAGDDRLFFTVIKSSSWEIWSSDGTVEGTVEVVKTRSGLEWIEGERILTSGDLVFFHTSDVGLHSFDTASGTLRQVAPGPIQQVVPFREGVAMLTVPSSETRSVYLWDGIADTAQLLTTKDQLAGLYSADAELFFFASEEANVEERTQPRITLYSSAGTEVAALVERQGEVTSAVVQNGILHFTLATRYVYEEVTNFLGDQEVVSRRTDYELWTSDGSSEGTRRIQTFPTDTYASGLTSFGDQVLFRSGGDDWISDGTPRGTGPFHEIVQHTNLGRIDRSKQFATAADQIFFSGTDIHDDHELWKVSEGLAERVRDVFDTGTRGSELRQLSRTGSGRHFFVAAGQLWRSDGTNESTVPVSLPFEPTRDLTILGVNNDLVFFSDYVGGEQTLWVSEGTGTRMVSSHGPRIFDYDIFWDPIGRSPDQVVSFAGKLFFMASESVDATKVWVSDGTIEGTKPFEVEGMAARRVYVQDGQLYLANGSVVWKSDGTEAGTRRVFEIPPRPDDPEVEFGTSVSSIRAVEDQLFVVTNRSRKSGSLIYVVNMASSTTPEIVESIDMYFHSLKLARVGNRVAMSLRGSSGIGPPVSLWVSNGMARNAEMLKDFTPGRRPVEFLMNLGDLLIFSADDGEHGREVWRTDGTVDGTFMLVDSVPGGDDGLRSSSTDVKERMTRIGDSLYFSDDNPNRQWIWRTDGTREGTVRIDTDPLRQVNELSALNDEILIAGNDGILGLEFWKLGPTATERIMGDADGDGNVGFEDFLALSVNFGKRDAVWEEGDFDQNGTVSFEDFLLLSVNFTGRREFFGG